ncbi:ribonuclease H-like domain-containing protein [Alphaproteobacteria bacterium endosymbiont of Tiliacea citrago]|uniref:ribonuclease H-like domain-containing protein n=1 Tax=Alphaproteobacteria bacterium endosymbiont of Tiliacea citrago TaxID=3077944 RepID=UPI00313B90C8
MSKNTTKQPENIYVHQSDLPEWVKIEDYPSVAIDTESMGLFHERDRLCLIQLTFDGKNCHLVQFQANNLQESPKLIRLLENKKIQKIFHFARFDCGLLFHTFGVMTNNIYCTKIASKLARTYTEKHGLKTLCNELLGMEISKKEQSSDWGKSVLTQEQKNYAAGDVLYLHEIRDKLNEMLEREGRKNLAIECFEALKCIIKLDGSGWSENLFAHL